VNNVKAKSHISFNLNFALLMLSAGRDEEASIALAKAVTGIEALPDDLFVDVEETEAE